MTIRREGTLITISVDEPKQVWPALNAASGGNPQERNVKHLTVSVTKGGQPASNDGVKIQASMILPSGGHSHTNQPPLDEIGEFEDYVNHVDDNGNITTTTDQNGNIYLAFTAPIFSGNVQVTAMSTIENTSAVDTISVEVPTLENFADIFTNFWRLTGNTSETSYKKCPSTEIEHILNHFATRFLIDSLQAALVDFFRWTGSRKGGGQYLVLGVNDMSLPWGGLLDICGDWEPGHSFHRVGASVDIDGSAVSFDSKAVTKLQPYQLKMLTRIMANHQGKKYPEEPIHFGFGGK